MKKKWNLLNPDVNAIEKIAREAGCSPVVAAIMVNRKLSAMDEVSRFLSSPLKDLRSPSTIKDMDRAAARICDGIIHKEKILIFGDYDVDGVTSTALLFEFLEQLGANVTCYIPHRTREGYGIQAEHIYKIASPLETGLIVTVDCGSSSHGAIRAAADAGIDVIITDHHMVGGDLPEAFAVVNPKRRDCPSGLGHLAGVGVVFYLIISLRMQLRGRGFWKNRPEPNLKNLCDLVALGTVADLVPLRHENRILVKAGLEVMQSGSRHGLKALALTSKIRNRTPDSEDISFRLAPRLNAAGRIDHAKTAFDLLIADQWETALPIAQGLEQLNTSRKEVEKQALEQIMAHLERHPRILDGKSLVLSHPDWHEGILGIVASRLTDKFFRPTILISTGDRQGKGSARSIPGFDIYKGLCRCRHCLMDFGGHSMAAGVKIRNDQIETFQKAFEDEVSKGTRQDDFCPELIIDYDLDFDEVSENLIDEIDILKPFGMGNREPLFMARNVAVLDPKLVGENHRRMVLNQPGGRTGKKIPAIHFNIDPEEAHPEFFDRVAFRLRWNHWNGSKTAQILIEDIEIE